MNESGQRTEQSAEHSLAERRAILGMETLAVHDKDAAPTDPARFEQELLELAHRWLDLQAMQIDGRFRADFSGAQLGDLSVRNTRRTRGVALAITNDGQLDLGRKCNHSYSGRWRRRNVHTVAARKWRDIAHRLAEQCLFFWGKGSPLRAMAAGLTLHPPIVYSRPGRSAKKCCYWQRGPGPGSFGPTGLRT